MRLSIAQQVLMSLLVVTCGLILHSVKISLLLLEQQHEGDEHLLQKQAWKSTNDNNPQKLSFQPRALFQDWWDAMTLQGGTSCDTVLQNVRQGIWMDPNHQQGQHFVRRISTAPHHYVSLHHPDYDRVRYKSIFEKGEYYERKVHARFESILQENNVAKNATALPIVVDVGANIGYVSV